LELRVPEAYLEDVRRFSQSQSDAMEASTPDDNPFVRYVDLWFVAVCVGFRRGARTKLEKPHRFITGEILSRDPERIGMLELLAVAATDDPSIVGKPSEVMDIANEFAATGLPALLEMLSDGNDKPIWNLTDRLDELLTTSAVRSPVS
jgi:hypothetical protein